MFEGVAYTMPPRAANIAGTVFLYDKELHIVAGRHEARHMRRKAGDPPASLPEHRAAKIAAVHGARARLYEMRQQILNVGADALTLMTALVHRAPERASLHVEHLHELFVLHGENAFRAALAQAVAARELTVAAVSHALDSAPEARSGASPAPAAAAQPSGHHHHMRAPGPVRTEGAGVCP